MGFKELRPALAFVAVLVSSGTVAGCGDDAVSPRLERVQAEERWSDAGIGTYSYTVLHSCGECILHGGRMARVFVRDGQVESRIFIDRSDEMSVPEAAADIYPAVEALFEQIRTFEADPKSDVIAEYDAGLGYPTRIAITSSDPLLVDGDVGWVISDFRSDWSTR